MKMPGWLSGLLHRVLPRGHHDELIGDLEELHRRRIRRWGPHRAGLVTSLEGVGLAASHAVRRLVGAVRRDSGWISGTELRLAVRLVRKQPVMTLTAVVSLGVGIGIAAGGISLFAQVLYGDPPFENGDRWVVVQSYDETGRRASLDLRRFRLFRSSAPAIEHLAAAEPVDFNLVHGTGEVERVSGARVTPGIFAHLPYVPLVGRLLTVGDGEPGSGRVALIRESLWRRSFSGSPDIVGRAIRLGDEPHVVVGVLPDGAGYPSEGEIWVPLPEGTAGAEGDGGPIAGSRAIGILAQGATVEGAVPQLAMLSERASASEADAPPLRHSVIPIADTIRSWQAQVAGLAVTVVLLSVLLVIAINVSNLIMARTSRRTAELAVRTALGASRARVVGQLLLEVTVMGALAAIPGLLAAGAILSTYDRVLSDLPFWIDLGLSPGAAGVVVVLALLASAAAGLLPALRATRSDPANALRAAGRGASTGIGRLGDAMITAEIALSVALLGFAILFARGFQAYLDPAFDLPDERVLTARVQIDVSETDLPADGAGTVTDSLSTVTRTLERTLADLPGVTSAGVTTHLPRLSPWPESLELAGRPDVVKAPLVHQGPGVFEALEVRPTVGRLFENQDREEGAVPAALVNESFAREHFGTVEVVGRRLRSVPHDESDDPGPWREIVGVVPDVMEVAAPEGAAGVYFPFTPRRFFYVALRAESEPMALAGRLRRAVFDLDPDVVVSQVVRLDAFGADNRDALAVLGSAMSAVGLVTLLLALAGVYSVVSLSVSRRTREIGVRVALGADRRAILWSILRRSGLLVLGGALVGSAIAFAGTRVRVFAFVVPDGGPWLFPSLVVVMAAAGALACWVPARRALAIHPVEALRHDG